MTAGAGVVGVALTVTCGVTVSSVATVGAVVAFVAGDEGAPRIVGVSPGCDADVDGLQLASTRIATAAKNIFHVAPGGFKMRLYIFLYSRTGKRAHDEN